MKYKKIIDLCKKSNVLIIYTEEKENYFDQYITDGRAIYSLSEVSLLDIDTLCQMYDIDESKRSKMALRSSNELPSGIDFSDTVLGETLCTQMKISITYNGFKLLALKTSQGIEFIDSKYLAPFGSSLDDIEIYERATAGNKSYFALKKGLILQALLLPVYVVTKEFIDELTELTNLCGIKYGNMKSEENLQYALGDV